MGGKYKPSVKKIPANQFTWYTQPIHWLPLNNIHIIITIIFILTPIVFGLLSVSFGQDNNWDLRNYHYYNPYAFIKGRLLFDYAPAQLQTYFNPALDFIFYSLVTHFSPKTVGFAMGAIQGFNFFLLFSICYYLFLHKSPSTRLLLALTSAIAGVYAPIMMGELGNSTNDVATSLFILGAVLIIVRLTVRDDNLDTPTLNYTLIAAGILIGLGTGFKLTLAVYGVSFLLAQLSLQRNWIQRIRLTAAATLGLVGGTLISSGFWMHRLWSLYGNPLFPFYNSIFKSPYTRLVNIADKRFLPEGLFDQLFFPFFFLFSNRYTDSQHHYRDARFAIIYILLLIIALIFFVKWLRANPRSKRISKEKELNPTHHFLIIFFVGSYITWQMKFSILRYTNVQEMLGPIVIFVLLIYIIKSEYYCILTYVLLLVMIAVGMYAPRVDRLSWDSTFFQVQVPRYDDPARTIVLMASTRPWAYLIPAFPEATRFLCVNSNFTNPTQKTRFQQEIRQILNDHDGPVLLLSRKEYLPREARLLASYDLWIDARNSLPVYSRHSRRGLRLWGVNRREHP